MQELCGSIGAILVDARNPAPEDNKYQYGSSDVQHRQSLFNLSHTADADRTTRCVSRCDPLTVLLVRPVDL